jgi:DNA-binding MarR family transcriptional regulator
MATSPRRTGSLPPHQAAASKPARRAPSAAPAEPVASVTTEHAEPGQGGRRQHGAGSASFLLAQLGAYAADRFAERIAALDLIPAQAGILRAIAAEPGRSQQALSEQLGLLPSRVVAFVDDLEHRGYVERRRNPDDRRLYALYLTTGGQQLLADIGKVARAHDEEITGGLTAAQREEFAATLQALASRHGLTPGVHPGYKSFGRNTAHEPAEDSAAG